ncbi:hypothetical protein H310_06380 [Aphanomyces invadans]|uniref:RING-type domain-containing protein n=1 Tax=Aphanomyces invadans TaxID=157072 RepID=A0A024U7E3_9STRA|nr:hypothetical protein H310_06380 [Aphanomyces invadans]ETW01802.1 hypothetical protein H310_06380 [Aphanomyces invadans]|eukprot:XP_008869650.1 hypothetical protein H310_06380 [Aphanomyces invadans]
MSASQKHSFTYQLDNSTSVQGTSPLIPVAKWTGGGGGSNSNSPSAGTPYFSVGNTGNAAAPSSSTVREGLQSRSRNIDIPNSRPRLRPKHSASSVSRASSSMRSLSARKSTLSSAAPVPTPLPTNSDLNWHTRPPRAGLGSLHPTPFKHGSSVQALKPRAKKPLSTRREELSFAPVEAPRGEGGSSGWISRFTGGDEETFAWALTSDSSKDPSSPMFRPTAAPIRIDAVEGLARALLSDCINKRNMEQSKVKKAIKIDTNTLPLQSTSSQASYLSPTGHESSLCMPPYEDGGGVLSCSSSDDELHQLYKLEPSFVWDKCRVDGCLNKMCSGSSHFHDPDHMTNSPDSDSYFEEQGLPKEIRYNLPIAYGTVNETEKHCTICQVAYEIGSHIVTLTPCQHFFHALCVDKWLWNHVTCPLCRKEVVYDLDKDTTPHVRGMECPEEDLDTMRRKLRSQCAEFRPVKPLKPGYTVDQLDAPFLAMQVQEDRAQMLLDHLACPTPQRKYPQ